MQTRRRKKLRANRRRQRRVTIGLFDCLKFQETTVYWTDDGSPQLRLERRREQINQLPVVCQPLALGPRCRFDTKNWRGFNCFSHRDRVVVAWGALIFSDEFYAGLIGWYSPGCCGNLRVQVESVEYFVGLSVTSEKRLETSWNWHGALERKKKWRQENRKRKIISSVG